MVSHFCVLTLFSLLASCLAACPDGCECPSSLLLKCSSAGLTSVPSQLPSTILGLDLSGNFITEIDASAFKTAKNLRVINLGHNRLSSLSLTNFINLPRLQSLSIADNGLTDVESLNNAPFVHSLAHLNLSGNHLRKIPALKLTKLERLILSHNSIGSSAFPASFSSCSKLQSIDLSNNQISGIAAKDFDSLTSLSVASLNFDSNRITSIEPKALTAVGLSLNNLNLNRNRLTAAALASALKGFREVHSIALATLSVCSNAITEFDGSVLAPLEHSSLTTLEMDGHRKLDLDPYAFQSVRESLRVLSLRDCGLSSLPDGVQFCPLLKTLRLDGNSFSTLPSYLPHSLVDLSMTQNGLRSWTNTALSRLTRLKRLDLSNNNLEIVTERGINPLGYSIHRLKQLGLEENPFKCSCDLPWFISWGITNNVVRNFKTLKCTSSDHLSGELLINMDISHCRQNRMQKSNQDNRGIEPVKQRSSARNIISDILRIFLKILSYFQLTAISLTAQAILNVLVLIPVSILEIVCLAMGYDYGSLLHHLKELV